MPKVEWNGDALVRLAEEACTEVARMTAEIVKGAAVDLCPLDSSQTRQSATVTELPKGAEISFKTPQAAWLHESQNYTPSHAGTGPNYLRQPLLDAEDQYQKDIAAALKAIWG
jgi:hypothetical protein